MKVASSDTTIQSKSILCKISELVSTLKSQINAAGKPDQIEKTNIQLEKSITEINDILHNISKSKLQLSDLLEKVRFRYLLDAVGSWILKNFSSPKLTSILSLMSSFLDAYEHHVIIPQSEIDSIIQCGVYNKLTETKEYETELSKSEISTQGETLSKEETLSKDSILTNHFLAAIYSLIVTISNKPEIIIKSKNLLRILTQISAQIAEIDNVAIFFKKRRLISVYNTIIKELKKSPEPSNLIQITKLSMYIFSKIGKRRPIYIDYIFRKALPDKISDIFLQHYQNDEELIKVFSLYTVFSTRITDHKTFYWTKGVIITFVEILNKTNNEELIETVSMAVYNLTKGSHEIQEDLRDQKYLELAKKLIVNHSTNNKIVYFTIATLRFIKDDDFYNTMSQELLYTFFALFDFYYITVKKEINALQSEKTNDNIQQLAKLSSETHFVVLKEIIAILGNIIKNEIHSKPFIDKNLHLVLIDVKLTFLIFPKLIKNTTGALINLTNNNEICDNLCKIAAFIQSIYMVLHQYQDNQFIVDYELKLIINLMKNEIAVNTFLSGDLMVYILSFIKKFKTNEDIVLSSFKILRCLMIKKKGMDEFNVKLFDFYQTIYNYGEGEDVNKAYVDFIDDIIFFLNEPNEKISVEIKIEINCLLAYLCNQNKKLKDIVDKNDNLLKSLN